MQVPPRGRIVVAVDVVGKAGLGIAVLAGEAEVVAADLVEGDAVVEGGQSCAPDDGVRGTVMRSGRPRWSACR